MSRTNSVILILSFLLGTCVLVFAVPEESLSYISDSEECDSDDACMASDMDYYSLCVAGTCTCVKGYHGNTKTGCHMKPEEGGYYDGLLSAMTKRFTEEIYVSAVKLNGYKENFVFSPLSVYFAAAMLLSAATNPSVTRTELLKFFGDFQDTASIGKSFERVAHDYNVLLFSEQRIAKVLFVKNLAEVLTIANGAWSPFYMKDVILNTFVRSALDVYETEYMFVNSSVTDTANFINNWISKKTKGKLDNIFGSHEIDPNYFLVLANVMYFNNTWIEPFRKVTYDEFTLLDGSKKSVKMMTQEFRHTVYPMKFHVNEEITLDISAIRCTDERYSMIMLMPTTHEQFIEFEEYLSDLKGFVFRTFTLQLHSDSKDYSYSLMNRIIDVLTEPHPISDIVFSMPEFNITSSIDVRKIFEEGGAISMFNQGEFSNASAMLLRVDEIRHKTTISVNPMGTEFLSATHRNIRRQRKSFLGRKILKLNKPFYFYIYESYREQVLFFGRVTDP